MLLLYIIPCIGTERNSRDTIHILQIARCKVAERITHSHRLLHLIAPHSHLRGCRECRLRLMEDLVGTSNLEPNRR